MALELAGAIKFGKLFVGISRSDYKGCGVVGNNAPKSIEVPSVTDRTEPAVPAVLIVAVLFAVLTANTVAPAGI